MWGGANDGRKFTALTWPTLLPLLNLYKLTFIGSHFLFFSKAWDISWLHLVLKHGRYVYNNAHNNPGATVTLGRRIKKVICLYHNFVQCSNLNDRYKNLLLIFLRNLIPWKFGLRNFQLIIISYLIANLQLQLLLLKNLMNAILLSSKEESVYVASFSRNI